jgi:hypothetical protein
MVKKNDMVELETYRAMDRRVYNGALCSDLQKQIDHTHKLRARMHKADPTARCTYFPAESKWLVATNIETTIQVGPVKILTGIFHEDEQEALIEAIKILETISSTVNDVE